MRFMEFLLDESVNVTVDPNDPAGSLQRAKEQIKTAARDPARAVRQRQQNLKSRDDAIDQEADPDVAKSQQDIQRDEERVAKKRMQLALVQKRKAAEKERANRAAGVNV